MIVENDWRILQIFPEGQESTGKDMTMDGQKNQQQELQTVMQYAYREELVERIGRAVREDGVEEPLPGLHLARSSVSLQPLHSVVEPSICVIAQGSKEVLLGER